MHLGVIAVLLTVAMVACAEDYYELLRVSRDATLLVCYESKCIYK